MLKVSQTSGPSHLGSDVVIEAFLFSLKYTFFILDIIMVISSLHNWIADLVFLQILTKNYIDVVSWRAGSYCVTTQYGEIKF